MVSSLGWLVVARITGIKFLAGENLPAGAVSQLMGVVMGVDLVD